MPPNNHHHNGKTMTPSRKAFVPKDQTLKQFEQEAKDAKKGLWADPNPVPPWLYRRLEMGAYP